MPPGRSQPVPLDAMPDLLRVGVVTDAASDSQLLTRDLWAVFFELSRTPIVGVDDEQAVDRVEVHGPVRPGASTRTILGLSRVISRYDEEDNYEGTEFFWCAVGFEGLARSTNVPGVDFTAYRASVPVGTGGCDAPNRRGASPGRRAASFNPVVARPRTELLVSRNRTSIAPHHVRAPTSAAANWPYRTRDADTRSLHDAKARFRGENRYFSGISHSAAARLTE